MHCKSWPNPHAVIRYLADVPACGRPSIAPSMSIHSKWTSSQSKPGCSFKAVGSRSTDRLKVVLLPFNAVSGGGWWGNMRHLSAGGDGSAFAMSASMLEDCQCLLLLHIAWFLRSVKVVSSWNKDFHSLLLDDRANLRGLVT